MTWRKPVPPLPPSSPSPSIYLLSSSPELKSTTRRQPGEKKDLPPLPVEKREATRKARGNHSKGYPSQVSVFEVTQDAGTPNSFSTLVASPEVHAQISVEVKSIELPADEHEPGNAKDVPKVHASPERPPAPSPSPRHTTRHHPVRDVRRHACYIATSNDSRDQIYPPSPTKLERRRSSKTKADDSQNTTMVSGTSVVTNGSPYLNNVDHDRPNVPVIPVTLHLGSGVSEDVASMNSRAPMDGTPSIMSINPNFRFKKPVRLQKAPRKTGLLSCVWRRIRRWGAGMRAKFIKLLGLTLPPGIVPSLRA